MKSLLGLLLALCAPCGAYGQDVYFFNATPSAFKIQLTLPNGAVESHGISESSDSMATDYFNLVPGIQEVKIQLLDGQGFPVCSGVARRDGAYTFFSALYE